MLAVENNSDNSLDECCEFVWKSGDMYITNETLKDMKKWSNTDVIAGFWETSKKNLEDSSLDEAVSPLIDIFTINGPLFELGKKEPYYIVNGKVMTLTESLELEKQ